MFREMSASELIAVLGTEAEPVLVDVREPDEVAEWSIPGALNIPFGDLPGRVATLPRDRHLVTVCASGSRSTLAARLLAANGLDVANLTGGMGAWSTVYDTATVAVPGARVVQVRRRGQGCLSYLVGSGDEAFVVDPSIDVDLYRQKAAEHGWRITRVFDTHLHADHLSGARALAEGTGASLHLNPADTFEFEFTPLSDGDRFVLPGGAELSVAVVHTPGHTAGSVLYRLGEHAVLSGDTLFVEGVGRPDLADRVEEFARNLHRSLHQKVLRLPDRVRVLPAHYGNGVAVRPGEPVAATLGELRTTLGPLSLDEDRFVEWVVSHVSDRPPNYAEIIKVNMGRTDASGELVRMLEAGPNRCSA